MVHGGGEVEIRASDIRNSVCKRTVLIAAAQSSNQQAANKQALLLLAAGSLSLRAHPLQPGNAGQPRLFVRASEWVQSVVCTHVYDGR